jgi:tetratricopeptide (TPR) repeat protein
VSSKHRFSAALLLLFVSGASLAFGQDAPPPEPTPAPAPTPASPPAPAGDVTTPAPPAEPNPAAAAALQQAKDAFKKGAWQDAQDAALKALALDPKDTESLYIAGASERQLGHLVSAEGHLRTLVDVSPAFPLSHFQLAYVLFLRAEAFTKEGQVEPAKAKYVEAATEFATELQRNPTHTASLSSRSIALSRAGKLEESVQAHEAWIAAVPAKNDPVVSLAATYAAAGRASDAMSALDRLPDKSQKGTFDAVVAAASVFGARRDWGAAVPFLEKAVATDPASTRAQSLLTEACARAGLANDAARNLQKLLTMDPTPDEAESAGEAIKSTMGDGKSAPAVTGVEPPALLRLPAPRYPKGQDAASVKTEVLVLAQVKTDATVDNTVMVPNRIWKDQRATGFEAAATDAVKRGKFTTGTKDGKPADLWLAVLVKFTHI